MRRTSYAFGLVRTFESAAIRAQFGTACDLLSKALGVVIFPQLSVSYRDLGDAFERGNIGFAWLPPLLAIELEDKRRITPVALPVRRGTTSYHAAILGRRGVVRTLDDLRGKRVSWVEKESAAGYAIPRMHLTGAGYDLRTLFASETFVHSHDAVIESLVSGRADVGASFCTLDSSNGRVTQASWTAPDGTSAKPVDVLALVGPIPNDLIVAANDVPPELRAGLLNALNGTGLRDCLQAIMRAEGYRPATSQHFDSLRRTIQAARERTEGPPPSRRG